MRLPPSRLLASLCLALFGISCGHGKSDGQCQHNFDCPAGQGCDNGICKVLPCGGCQPDQACGADGNCVTAQGATCADHACPAAFPCNTGGVCAKQCTLDSQCDPGLFCNSALKSCTQCAFDSQCAGKAGKPVCNTTSGFCAACNADFDCVKALGTGHFCDAHVCKVGCKTNDDCSASLGETCDTSVTPGKCVQCHTNADCAAQGPSASACDNTGHCVQCWGPTQTAANYFCNAPTPECNLTLKQCVGCLPANNPTGQDCGYDVNGTKDPHDARTCDPATYSCTNGCQVDAQCGCPRNALGGVESDCLNPDGTTHRVPDQEHCDPKRTTMTGFTGATQGACVQCTDNTHCEYKIHGTTQYSGAYATMNGARCVADGCLEGCDTDNDCWPDHATSNGKICHVGASGDPNNNKCVECKCDVPGADGLGAYCELNSAGGRACNPTAGGDPRVCDAHTLLCRKKDQNEQCTHSNECGDIHDPTVGGCVPSPAACVINWHPAVGTGHSCGNPPGAYGRCGVSCNDIQNNYCVSTTSCPNGSRCQQASAPDFNAAGAGTFCVSNLCTY
jgi:hypothetical protein